MQKWERRALPADAIFQEVLEKWRLPQRDRAFALTLFLGVMRNLRLLDFWIKMLRSGRVESSTRQLLRLGIHQLSELRSQPHAAVNETVNLASLREKPLVNAVLRSFLREENSLQKAAREQPLTVRTSHPDFLVRRWTDRYGEAETAALCEWNQGPAPIYARINTLSVTRADFLRRYHGTQAVEGNDIFVKCESLPVKALLEGHCYVQDPSTFIACQLLNPQPGEHVLDACAAPGGKASLLAQLANNQAAITACDRDPRRVAILVSNLQRLGVANPRILKIDWLQDQPPSDFRDKFDRILLDIPCTNTGVIRRRADVRWRLREDDFERMAQRQRRIIHAVMPCLRLGGTLSYSTCSLEAEENEDIVEWVHQELPELKFVEMRTSTPMCDGFDGAFVALFRRS